MLRRALALTVLGLLLGSSTLLASPCTSDFWQPTFVHDLDTDDWPFYVTSGGSFVKLEHREPGGFYPHACELVRGPQDVRDTRGFTSCREYTRIQCGCSRNIPGNQTCAAFLRWHTAATPVPGAPGASTSQPPSSAAVSPPPVAPPIARPPAAPPPIASPGATVPGPTAPPVPPRPQQVSIPPSPGSWQQAPQYNGAVQAGSSGLVLQGGAWTNGRLKDGFYDGNRVFSAQSFDLSGGGDVRMRFLVNGGGKYMGFWPRVFEGVSVHHMTTDHSWANSVVVPENAWIFAHLHVDPGGGYRVAVAQGNYDDRGGQVVYNNTGRLANPRGRLDLQFGDNYGGADASIVIGEATVAAGAGGQAGGAPSTPMPPRSTGGGGGRAAGAACGAPSDCASSICLLGVCAP